MRAGRASALPAFFLIVASSMALFSCRPGPEDGLRSIRAIATLFPIYDMARAIGGEKADVSLLLPPGVEPHSFGPKPGDIAQIDRSDIFIYTGAFRGCG